jgi:hypothetical protein
MPAPKKRRTRTRTPRPEIIYDYYGQPLTTTIARSHVVELFVKRPAWNRIALVKAVEEAHSQAGGVEGHRGAMVCVNDALKGLKNAKIVNNEVVGLWRLVGKLPDMVRHGQQALLEMEIEAPTPVAVPKAPEPIKATESVESAVIGEGEESVSVLFNPNDQRLAELEGRDRWECRISRSANNDLPLFSRHPVTGLVIRCNNAAALESALQACLSFMNAETGGVPNSGWFYTSPDAVKQWFLSFQQSLAQFSST